MGDVVTKILYQIGIWVIGDDNLRGTVDGTD